MASSRPELDRVKSAEGEPAHAAVPTFDKTAPRLAANGYEPVPIEPGTKRCRQTGWQRGGFADRAARFRTDFTGLLTADCPAVDIDVSDAALVAELRSIVFDVTGCHEAPPPSRIGMMPRTLLLFRTEEPFPKISTGEFDLPSNPIIDGKRKPSKVEILADGQQFVAFAVHPDTHGPYSWNGAGDPLEIPRSRLPVLNEVEAGEIIRRADELLSRHGQRINKARISQARSDRRPNGELRAKDPALLREALAAIPNADEHFDDWIAMLYAVKAALGDDGLDAFTAWSAGSGKHDEAFARQQWRSAKPTMRGAGSILWLARQHGWAGTAKRRPQQDVAILTAGTAVELTEDAIACAFANRHRDELLFDFSRGKWLAWDGTRWRADRTELAYEYARRTTATLNRENRARWARAAVYAAVERIARSDRTFARTGDEFDRDPFLLNTPAGTVDLHDGALREHRREDLITMLTGSAPKADPRPIFDRFLADITRGDRGLANYLQRSLGACLSGALTDHFLLFWHGDGRNGKNTLGDLLLMVLGDYARKIPAQTLMTDPRGGRHPTEIANLRGLRLAVSSEVGEGEHWDEAKVKELTGDGKLTGRFMRCDFFEFPRTHKHLVFGNNRPMLRIVDRAMAERLHMVPFVATFTAGAGNLDPDMPAKLRTEAGAVLAWLVDGHMKWREDGTLRRCSAVEAATADYFASHSTIDMWIAERCVVIEDDERGGRLWAKSGLLYQDFSKWKKDRGEHPMSATRWGEQMTRRFRKVEAHGIRYIGLLLREEAAP
jgi:P4 family phage/plasmid primase-like protien